MTLPSTIPNYPSYILNYGCQVTIFPADQINRIEVWRAPDSAGAANDAAAVQATVLPPGPLGGVTFVDPLPNDGAKRYYKSRHIDAFGNTSLFTNYSEALIPEVVTGSGAPNPMAAFGAIVDQVPPNTLYEMRMAANYPDPDSIDGVQSFIDFPANSYFMRIGQTPVLVEAAANNGSGLIRITITNHGFTTGDTVIIRGHLGVTNANSAPKTPWAITVIDASHFDLQASTFSGVDTPNTGHCVRLALTVDSLGNLIVYAIVRASQLIVNGIATFNGVIKSLAGALFRTLQHSLLGNVGDSVARVMLQSNNVELYGDTTASGGASATGGEDKLVGMLGSYNITPPATLTPRSSQDIGFTAGSKGWLDTGDGSDNGQNSLTFPRNGSGTVVAANRLVCELGDPTSEGQNSDAWDDKYTLKFRVGAKLNSSAFGPNARCDAFVQIEYSTDSGSNWTTLAPSYSASAVSNVETINTYNPTVTVAGAPSHVWFRLALQVQTLGDPGDPTGTGRVICFASLYRTDNYAVTWTSSSTLSYARRSVKVPKQKQPQQLSNRDFESGLIYWAQTAGTAVVVTDATKAHGGTNYMQITTSGAAAGDAVATDAFGTKKYFPVTPGDIITFGGWAYRESGTSSVRYVLETYDASKVLVVSNPGTSQNTAAWVQVSDTYTIPASGVSYIALYLDVSAVATTVARFDDASLVIGTDDLPHVYLEPVDVIAADTKTTEGELQFVGGTAHALAYKDDEKMRYVPKVIWLDGNKSITNVAPYQSISAATIKAQRVNVIGRGLRIRATGRIGANTGTVTLKIGNSDFSAISLTSGQSWEFDHTIYTNAVGASGSLSVGGRKGQTTTYTADEGNMTQDLTADFLIDMRGFTVGGVALTLRTFIVEWLN